MTDDDMNVVVVVLNGFLKVTVNVSTVGSVGDSASRLSLAHRRLLSVHTNILIFMFFFFFQLDLL